ncbi:ribosomal protein S18-alanine N-acetyltransferase [Alteromonadaceae bacterium BrNp21-10]|nr:ribosomal protein S18-alanine N-acetyltransferase [Alteromonadaceae bacterium BrNp21-10]
MATLSFSVVDATNADVVYALQNQCQEHPWSEANFRSSLRSPYFPFAVTIDDVVVGYYFGHQVLSDITLIDIGVSPNYRGQGIGKAMVEHLSQQALSRNAQEIWLEVRVSNATAIKLYQQADFEVIETRKDYYQSAAGKEDAFVMGKVL